MSATQEELKADYVENETVKGGRTGAILGGTIGASAGLAIGAEAGAAMAIGGGIVAAPVVVPAAIGAACVGAVGAGIAHVSAKNKRIDALERDGLKKSRDGAKNLRLVAKTRKKQLENKQKGLYLFVYQYLFLKC